MASEGGHWLLPIPCCSREYRSVAHLQTARQSALAERLGSSQPTRKEEVGVPDSGLQQVDTHTPKSCIPTLMPASTPLILHKSRMRRRARTDLSGGRPVMSVPTGTVENKVANFDLGYGVIVPFHPPPSVLIRTTDATICSPEICAAVRSFASTVCSANTTSR